MESYTPAALDAVDQTTLTLLDLVKVEKAYETNKKKISFAPVKVGRKVVQLILNGSLTGENISVSSFDDGAEAHTIGFVFDSEDDLAALKELNTELFTHVNGFKEDEWEIIETVKNDDKLYLKLKFDAKKTKYNFKSNVKLSPKTPTGADLHRHDAVSIAVEFSQYFNLDEKKCGLMFTVRNIDLTSIVPEPVTTAAVEDPPTQETRKAKRAKKD